MTSHLMDIFPDVDVLAQLSAADLAPAVLAMAYHVRQDGKVHAQQILQQVHGPNNDHSRAYPQQKKQSAENSLNAAWNWLLLQGLLIPEPGFGGNSGWHVFSAEGEKLATTGDFESFKQAAAFPKMLVHQSIRDGVWLDLARGEYDTAVFKSLKAVEEGVRAAGNFPKSEIGVELMRKAFKPGIGPLVDPDELPAEQEMLMHLFAGAIGYYKNPQSHRSVNVEALPAREVVILASHLLRIVDERRKKLGPSA